MLAELLWRSPDAWPTAVVLGLAAAMAALWLYRPQTRRLAPPWRWILPGLRITGLLVLAASILKPVILRPRTENDLGQVLILVDRSASMSVVDPHSPAHLVALADAMGMLPAGLRKNQVAELQSRLNHMSELAEQVVRANRDLEYARLSEQGVAAATARAATAMKQLRAEAGEVSRKASLPALAALATIPPLQDRDAWAAQIGSKLEQAGRSLARLQEAADAALYRQDERVRQACQELIGCSRLQLVDRMLTRGGLLQKLPGTSQGFAFARELEPLPLRYARKPVPRLMVEATGTATDLSGAIRKAMEQSQGQNVRAIVLFSDGRQTGSETPPVVAGAPVLAVTATPRGLVRDLSIIRMSAPASLFVGDTMTIRASIRNSGMQDLQTQVRLDGGEYAQSRQITLPRNRVTDVEFQLNPQTPGILPFTVSIPAVDGEISLQNNVQKRWVKVLKAEARITALSSEAGWDFQYLRGELDRASWVKLQSAILSPGSDPAPPADQLLRQDVVILSDVAPQSLSSEQWDAIRRLVVERGGSLILQAGPRHLPLEYSELSPLADLLPYADASAPAWRVWPGETPAFRLTPGPETADFLKLAEGVWASRQRWQQLSAFSRCLPLSGLKSDVVRTLLVESQSGAPVMTESRRGRGRVFFLGFDETWRWRDQNPFWQQLVRYAMEEPYAASDEGLALDADVVSASIGQPVNVRARAWDESGQIDPPQLEILQDGQETRFQPMSPADGPGADRYETVLTDLTEGDYELKLSTPTASVRYPLHVGARTDEEMSDLSPDIDRLRQLARATGGELLPLEDANAIPAKLAEIAAKSPRYTQQPLWDGPYLFLFVLACFGAEWAFRKRLGLA